MNQQEVDSITAFKARMAAIALANDDEFKVDIEVSVDGYSVEVTETADGHTFLNADGPSIESMLNKAYAEIPECLEAWGYKDAR